MKIDKKMIKKPELAIVLVGSMLGMATNSWAGSAEVLPKGVSRVGFGHLDYLHIDKRYDPDGNAEDIGADFGRALDGSAFPLLTSIETGFGMGAGTASLGDSTVDMGYDIKIFEMTYEYGLTNKVSLGLKVPYWWVNANVSASVDSSGASSATVGLNPNYIPFDANPVTASPVIPLAGFGPSTPATTEDIQNILGGGLSVNGSPAIAGFGYDRIDDWKRQGIADIEVGARYQYRKDENWRHAFTGGLLIPTGKTDDPDNLVDLKFGSGAYAILLRSNHDYVAAKDWVLNATFKYDLILADKEEMRVPDAANLPLTNNKENVSRDIGDRLEVDMSAKYQLLPSTSISATYRYAKKAKDSVSGDMGYAYTSLEDETDLTEQQYLIGISYSTVPAFMAKKAKIPLIASLTYRDRFAGTNNVLKSKYVKASLLVMF